MSWITDKLLGVRRVVFGADTLPERGALEFAGQGVEVEDDATNKRTVVTVSAAAEGVVAATPSTIPLRGSAGELLATRVEASAVRTSASGNVSLQHGTTTFRRFFSTDALTQPGDEYVDPVTGQPYVHIDGVGAVPLLGQSVRFHKEAPDAAPSSTTVIPIFAAPGYFWTITGVTFTPNDALISNATNYADLRIRIMDGATIIGDAAIAVTTPSGTNSTGTWTTFVPVSFTLSSLLAFPIEPTHYAMLVIGKPASGVAVPAGLLNMVVKPWKEP